MNISENVLESKIHWGPTMWTTWFVTDTVSPSLDLLGFGSQVSCRETRLVVITHRLYSTLRSDLGLSVIFRFVHLLSSAFIFNLN